MEWWRVCLGVSRGCRGIAQGAGAEAAVGVQPAVLPGVRGWEARDLGPLGPMDWSWASQAQK